MICLYCARTARSCAAKVRQSAVITVPDESSVRSGVDPDLEFEADFSWWELNRMKLAYYPPVYSPFD